MKDPDKRTNKEPEKEPEKEPKSFRVTKGNTTITVYPYNGGWRFAWRSSETAIWKYVTRKVKAAAKAAAENKLDELNTGGLSWSSLSPHRRRFLESIHRETRAEDENPLLTFLKGRQKSSEIVQTVDKYLAWKIKEAGEKTPHIGNLGGHLKPTAQHFAGKTVVDITTDELQEWWQKKWGHRAWKTRRDCRGSFIGFWRWCVLQSLYPKDQVTPAECMPPVKAEKLNRRILTLDEFLALAGAIQPKYRGAIVLQAFCGMRPEETAPPTKEGTKKKSKRGIRAEEIDWKDNCIRIPAEVAKTGFPRITPVLPAAKAWLEWAGVHSGSNGPVCYTNLVEDGETLRLGKEVFKTGWPKDALRHSYGSYRNAIVRSLPQVAEEMGTSETMLKRHYLNPRSKEEGEAWFALRPS